MSKQKKKKTTYFDDANGERIYRYWRKAEDYWIEITQEEYDAQT